MEISHLELCIPMVCLSFSLRKSLYLFPSAAAGSFSDDAWKRHLLIYEYSRISLGVILSLLFTPGLWLSSIGSLVTQAVLTMGSMFWSGPYANSNIGELLPHTLCYHCPNMIYRQNSILNERYCAWVCIYNSLLVACKVLSHSKTLGHRDVGSM